MRLGDSHSLHFWFSTKSFIELLYQVVHEWYENCATIILFRCGIRLRMHNTNKKRQLRKLLYFFHFYIVP